MHLVSHFKMKSAIVMILLAMVAVTQANKTGMNNIYGCINRVFMAQKYINKLQQRKEKSQYIVLKYYIENSAFAYENYADLGRNTLYTSVDNTLLDLHNSSYHTHSHPIIVEYKN